MNTHTKKENVIINDNINDNSENTINDNINDNIDENRVNSIII